MAFEASDWLFACRIGANMFGVFSALTSFLRSARNEAMDLSHAFASGGSGDFGQ